MERTVAIIPALNPLTSLIQYVYNLKNINIEKVIVVNDGSEEKYKTVFHELRNIKNCIVLEHDSNKGKGKALKTGFHYIINNFKKVDRILTLGAHGQHTIEDVKLILKYTEVFSDGIILGTRNFQSKEMSIMNTIGNKVASKLFQLLFHKHLLDTQTGLRCIPKKELLWLINVPGDSFDYDTNMLVEAIKRKIPIYEIPINNVHIKKNSIMHYDEIIYPQEILQQMLSTYKKQKYCK